MCDTAPNPAPEIPSIGLVIPFDIVSYVVMIDCPDIYDYMLKVKVPTQTPVVCMFILDDHGAYLPEFPLDVHTGSLRLHARSASGCDADGTLTIGTKHIFSSGSRRPETSMMTNIDR